MITATKKPKPISAKTNLWLDAGLFLAFLVTYEEEATGVTIHEWLGVALASALLIHLLLHWQWVVQVTARFFHKLKVGPRFNYLLDLGIFISFSTLIFTGLMISKSVLPALGLASAGTGFWKWLHFRSADATLGLMALHVALHWKWIVAQIRRYLLLPLGQHLRGTRQAGPQAS